VWELVLGRLERHHDVLAPTLAGHAGGPPLHGVVDADSLPDGVERAMDAAGFATAHLAGNSLGGFVALQLAARGRAESVTAFAPAGGWARGDGSYRDTLDRFSDMQHMLRIGAAGAAAMTATPAGRAAALRLLVEDASAVGAELAAHLVQGAAACPDAAAMIAYAKREGYDLDAARVACPVRVVWGTADRLLEWPRTAQRFRRDWLPHAEWIELEGVGHCPHLEVPLETAQLILGMTGAGRSLSPRAR